jgi:hypothetical protein
MSYRNKTYVIFDGDKDIWAYGYMLGWRSKDHMDFDFHDAHELNTITDRANEQTVKAKLRERFKSAKQVIVLVGESTKDLYRFVRWEIDIAIDLGLPIIVANLNGTQKMDLVLCPPILKGKGAVHVSFNMKIIQKAMDEFAGNYISLYAGKGDNYHYEPSVYTSLGL